MTFERYEPVGGIAEGGRNTDVYRYASSLNARRVTEAEALLLCRAKNQSNRPPLPDAEVAKAVRSAYGHPAGHSAEFDRARGIEHVTGEAQPQRSTLADERSYDLHLPDPDELPEPPDLDGPDMLRAQVNAMFDDGDLVNVVGDAIDGQPYGAGVMYTPAELAGEAEYVLDCGDPDAGVWLRVNPTDGKHRKDGVDGKAGAETDEDVTAYRHVLVEADPPDAKSMSEEELAEAKRHQLACVVALRLPCSCLVDSGHKSVHAIVRVADDGEELSREEWEYRRDLVYKVCDANGLKHDPSCKNPSRLCRLAGVRRGGATQALLATNVGFGTFSEWQQWVEERAGKADAVARFERLFKPVPAELQPLPPVLIENTFRKGGVMLIGGAPKVGKSFLAAQMVVSFVTGKPTLGLGFTRCERVLVVNSEMGEAEYDNRIVRACQGDQSTIEEVHRRVRVAHTDAFPEMTVVDIAQLICDSGYRPDVVIIDPIYPLFLGDENDNEDAKKTLGQLKMIASRTGAGVIYEHHFSKGSQDLKEARDRVSGAGTLGRNYSAMWSITELAPSEEDMADYPEGSVVVRVSTDLRSFRKSDADRNADFNAVRVDGVFTRDDSGRFDKALTREAARRAEASRKTAQREGRMDKVRKKIKKLLDGAGGEPVLLSTVHNTTAVSQNTLKDYLLEMDEYQLVHLRVDGKGQKRCHVAWATWQQPLDIEL